MSDYFITSYINRYTVSLYKNSYGVSSNIIDGLFSSTFANSQANLDSLAVTVLGQGIDFFQKENYKQAVISFKQAAALSPQSANAASAYDYMGQAYKKLDEKDNAIKTYREAIRLYPTNDELFVALADIYMEEGRQDEAAEIYEKAVNLNSNNAESQYSLGQCYLTARELDKARERFNEVIRISPANSSGYYGLGQVARAAGDLPEAIDKLTQAIRKDRNFELAYLELGYAYADQGDLDKANSQLSVLESKDSAHATELEDYIIQSTQPKITAAMSLDGFNISLGPKTAVSALSSKLEDPGKSKLFSMNIAFSKDMDEASIINPYNWKISRATIRDNGGVYNYGLPPTTKETVILPSPAYITYNADTNTATVRFWISQNETADATIDPNHIVFKFSGIDAYGKAMDTSADEYSGFSSIA